MRDPRRWLVLADQNTEVVWTVPGRRYRIADMRFLLLMCADEDTPVPNALAGCVEWQEAMAARNALVTTVGLHPPETASTLRVRGGEVLMTDGPFAETKEQMGGFAMIEAPSAEEARQLAATHPWAKIGVIEVRQILP